MSSFESYIVSQVALEIYPLPDTPTIDYVAIPDPHPPAPLNLVLREVGRPWPPPPPQLCGGIYIPLHLKFFQRSPLLRFGPPAASVPWPLRFWGRRELRFILWWAEACVNLHNAKGVQAKGDKFWMLVLRRPAAWLASPSVSGMSNFFALRVTSQKLNVSVMCTWSSLIQMWGTPKLYDKWWSPKADGIFAVKRKRAVERSIRIMSESLKHMSSNTSTSLEVCPHFSASRFDETPPSSHKRKREARSSSWQ